MSRKQRIQDKLTAGLSPVHLEVIDESYMHSVPEGAESHFKVILVSDQFADQGLVVRHRAVNRLLADEMAGGLHALALHTWTPEEWFAKGGVAPESPECMGGSKAG
jgi:BolA protein